MKSYFELTAASFQILYERLSIKVSPYYMYHHMLLVMLPCLADHPCHSHMTYAVVEKSSVDGGYMIKALKQKQFVDGLLYLLQEIYGIENKQTDRSKVHHQDSVFISLYTHIDDCANIFRIFYLVGWISILYQKDNVCKETQVIKTSYHNLSNQGEIVP